MGGSSGGGYYSGGYGGSGGGAGSGVGGSGGTGADRCLTLNTPVRIDVPNPAMRDSIEVGNVFSVAEDGMSLIAIVDSIVIGPIITQQRQVVLNCINSGHEYLVTITNLQDNAVFGDLHAA